MFKTILRRMKWLVLIIWCMCLVLLGAKFAQHNPQLLQVDLLLWTLPSFSAGLVLCMVLLVGVVLGALMFIPMLAFSRAKIRRLQGQLLRIQKSENQRVSAFIKTAG